MKGFMGKIASMCCLIGLLIAAGTGPAITHAQTPEVDDPITYRVFVILIDPEVTYRGRTMRVTEYFGHSETESVETLKRTIEEGSNHCLDVQITDQVRLDEFPRYTICDPLDEESFFKLFPSPDSWYGWVDRNRELKVLPDGLDGVDKFDYEYIFEKFDLVGKKNRDELDAVWIFSVDPLGMWEANVVGRADVRSNGKTFIKDCDNFLMLGLAFSRVDGATESFCHAIEGIMNETYGVTDEMYGSKLVFEDISELNTWQKFYYCKDKAEDSAEVYGVGQVHFAPNSVCDYDWSNPAPVQSWYLDFAENYPEIGVSSTEFTPKEAYGSLDYPYDALQHHTWWMSLMPHYKGRDQEGYLNNWWQYVVRCDPTKKLMYSGKYASGTVQVPSGGEVDDVTAIVERRSGAHETLKFSDMVCTISENGCARLEGDKLVGISPGEERLTVKLDGRALEYQIVVAEPEAGEAAKSGEQGAGPGETGGGGTAADGKDEQGAGPGETGAQGNPEAEAVPGAGMGIPVWLPVAGAGFVLLGVIAVAVIRRRGK